MSSSRRSRALGYPKPLTIEALDQHGTVIGRATVDSSAFGSTMTLRFGKRLTAG